MWLLPLFLFAATPDAAQVSPPPAATVVAAPLWTPAESLGLIKRQDGIRLASRFILNQGIHGFPKEAKTSKDPMILMRLALAEELWKGVDQKAPDEEAELLRLCALVAVDKPNDDSPRREDLKTRVKAALQVMPTSPSGLASWGLLHRVSLPCWAWKATLLESADALPGADFEAELKNHLAGVDWDKVSLYEGASLIFAAMYWESGKLVWDSSGKTYPEMQKAYERLLRRSLANRQGDDIDIAALRLMTVVIREQGGDDEKEWRKNFFLLLKNRQWPRGEMTGFLVPGPVADAALRLKLEADFSDMCNCGLLR